MVRAKGAKPGLEVALVIPDRPNAASGRRDVGSSDMQRLLAYVDSVVIPSGAIAGTRAADIDSATAGRLLTIRGSVTGADDGKSGSLAFLDLLMTRETAAASTVWLALPGLSALRGLCTTMQFFARSLDGGFEMTAPERAPAGVFVEGRPGVPAAAARA
jgi:hypothetical protein